MFNYVGLLGGLKRISTALTQVQGKIFNTKFILTVGSNGVIVDPVTGNYTFQDSTTVEAKANLRPKNNPKEDINIGTPFTRLYLEGKLVEPLNYSGELTNFVECEILNSGSWIKGKFYPELNLSSAVVESFDISKALGTTITGYFEIDGDLSA